MKTQRNKYHLKKVEPVKNRPQIQQYKNNIKGRQQKASVLSTKKHFFQPFNDPPTDQDYNKSESQIYNEHEGVNLNSQVIKQSLKPYQNLKQSTYSSIKNKKLQISSRNKSLKFWDKKEQFNFILTLKGFFHNLLQSDKGCSCGTPCPLTFKLFQYTKLSEDRIREAYQDLLVKATEMKTKSLKQKLFKDQQGLSMKLNSIQIQIKKDMSRTQSQHPTFQNNAYIQAGSRILFCYAIQDPEINYIQGMNIILSGILYHAKDQAKSYYIFRSLMRKIRPMYLQNFEQAYKHLNLINKLCEKYINDLYRHLGQLNIDINIVCFPWIISLFTALLPLEYLHLIYQGFMDNQWDFIYRLCLSIFLYHKSTILETNDFGDVLELFSVSNIWSKNVNWANIVQYADKLKL